MRIAHLGLLGFFVAALIGVGCGSDDGPGASGDDDDDQGGSSSSGGASSSSSSGSKGASSSSSGGSSGTTSSSGGSTSSSGGATNAPWLVQCFYGAATPGFEASNPEIESACSALAYDKVKTCAEDSCKTGWAFTAANAAYDALFDTLDDNDDNAVDDEDAPHAIALMGHSWGGMNIADVGKKLMDDTRVAASRKTITLGVAWDPYNLSAELLPPANFERFMVLRHSISGDNDCSSSIGPFYGKAPRCAAGQGCEDYDYSLNPNDSFPAYPRGTIKGKDVEHCNTFNVGFPVAKAILDAAALPPLPTEVAVVAP